MLTRPSPSMVVACIAVVISLGGTGWAATQLPEKSVGRAQLREGAVGNLQIRDKAITAGKIRSGAVTSAALRDKSVRRIDLAPDALPKASLAQASGDEIAPGAVGAVSAQCPAGTHVTGGGGGFAGPPITNDKMVDSIPVGDERPVLRWRVSLFNGGTAPRTPVAYAICTT